jgi:hypothetical protein
MLCDFDTWALYSVGLDAGRPKVSAAWARKTWPEKLRYRDVDYLKTLREVATNAGGTNVPHPDTVLHAPLEDSGRAIRLNGNLQVSKVSLQKTATLVSTWVKKIQSDVSFQTPQCQSHSLNITF